MTQQSSLGGNRSFELWGLLLPVKRKEEAEPEGEEEEKDDDDDRQSLCDAFSGSDQEFSRPACETIVIQDEISEETYEVTGRFPFIDPWWKVNVTVKQAGSKYYVKGYPSYFLQTDAGKNQVHIISLFFKKCDIPEEFKDAFFKWLPEGSSLNFIHLEKILKQFQESKLQEGKISTNTQRQMCTDTKNFDIFHYVKNSAAGKAVLAALAFPIILEFLPTLLPRSVSYCIEMLDWSRINHKDDNLTKLNKILKEEPWKLGFRVLMMRELQTYLGEASWKAISKCRHLLEKIPDLQKNALIVYEKLQQSCREMGHTYEEQNELTRLVSKDMPVEHAWQSLKFMKDEKIVVTERELVFLPHLFKSEKQIADSVCELRNKTPWQLHADSKKVLNRGTHVNNSSLLLDKNKIIDEEPCEMDQKEPDNTSVVQENCYHGFDFKEPKKESKCKIEVDPDQESAIELICSNPVTIISGKGGCGKTTVVTHLFRYLNEVEAEEAVNACKDFEADLDASEEWNTFSQPSNGIKCRNESLNILYTAPTGRAASLLCHKANCPAYTLHQVTCSYSKWEESGSPRPWKFSAVNVLVVDEGSMVPVRMLSCVLQLLLHHAKLAKLVILGDVRQLPSIEPGNMLADIFESLKSRGWSIELKTNHRAESQLIVDNAIRISQRKYPIFDAELRISEESKTWPMPSPEKKFIFVVLPPEDGSNYLLSAIKTLLKRGPGLEDPEQSQFISFRREDCDVINEICCQHYSGHPMQYGIFGALLAVWCSVLHFTSVCGVSWFNQRNCKNQLQFLCGDKICSTRNAYMKDLLARDRILCTKNDKASKNSRPCICNICLRREACLSDCNPRSLGVDDDRRLCNGEIFFIKKDEKVDGCRFLTVNITDGPEYTIRYGALQRTSKIRHAWARTIHTFQGSEENTIVYVVGNTFHQNWQHVYTAVTRGRHRVYIVAEETKLRTVIAKNRFHRNTRLNFLMKVALATKDQMSPEKSCQSYENDTSDVASHAGNSFLSKEEPAVSVEMEVDHGLRTTVESTNTANEASLHSGEHKRRSQFPDDCTSPSKVSLVTEKNSPLGTNRLRSMTLKSPVSKQLFP
ncbi:LOW QUALITY PROTEIN: DNA helicase B [Rhineura floridana]|uniref:LOW QUALITY PROTEIN: DNA helicase B n=1 Tax=Rhineura floridana TaxID=261503 RepID=UPI002AC8925A|nr:LOW QUALITY PROTEIN: DNA helicase B [Rhineura floridana]